MFYTNRVLFVHVPRCGGSWLTEHARQSYAASYDIHYLKHAPLERIWESIPETQQLIPFAIARDKQDSEMAWWTALVAAADDSFATDEWKQYIQQTTEAGRDAFMAGYNNPFQHEYYKHPIMLFPYEYPLVAVVAWLEKQHAH